MVKAISHIGHWAQRIYEVNSHRNTQAHLVESEIGDRVVTRCGRQMAWMIGTKSDNYLKFTVDQPDSSCAVCNLRRAV